MRCIWVKLRFVLYFLFKTERDVIYNEPRMTLVNTVFLTYCYGGDIYELSVDISLLNSGFVQFWTINSIVWLFQIFFATIFNFIQIFCNQSCYRRGLSAGSNVEKLGIYFNEAEHMMDSLYRRNKFTKWANWSYNLKSW